MTSHEKAPRDFAQFASEIRSAETHVGPARKPCTLDLWLSLLFLCSCATTPAPAAVAPATELPADVIINKDAGRGNLLLLMLRWEGGEELPFVVDTGSEATIVDKSLEPKLGKRRSTGTFWNFNAKQKAGVYGPPKLYLGSTLLRNDGSLCSVDLKRMSAHSSRPIMGILGMDCLRYYCIQLDFGAGKMRFVDPVQLDIAKLGTAFPMTLSGIGNSGGEFMRPFIHSDSLIGGADTILLIDTGYRVDGALESGLFRREVRQQGSRAEGGMASVQDSGRLWCQKCVWNSATYTNLLIGDGGTDFEKGNGECLIGLRFLARHLVTFDFPTRTFYLKQTSIGPLVDENVEAATEFLNKLKENNQLPGWSSSEKGTIYCDALEGIEAFDGRKDGDASTYHYIVARASKGGPRKLRKAWRTDPSNRTVQKYPMP